MSSRTLLKGTAIGDPNPGRVLTEVNDLLEQDNEAAMFVTMFYAVFDPATGQTRVRQWGGTTPRSSSRPRWQFDTVPPQTDGIALGIMPDVDFAQNEITLSPGDILVL